MNNTTIKVIIESKLGYLPLLRKTVRGICSSVVQDEQTFQDIDLCLNEALTNVIYHAYQNEPGHEIQIVVTLHPKEVVLQIIDAGLQNLKTNYSLPTNEDFTDVNSLSESGRGLFIIHQLMDKVIYKSENNQNILVLHKYFK